VRAFSTGRALLLAVGLLFLATAHAGRALSPTEAEATCRYWADVYASIAQLRAEGVPAGDLVAHLDKAIAAGRVPKNLRESYVAAVQFVYEATETDPGNMWRGIYESCYKDKTSVSASDTSI